MGNRNDTKLVIFSNGSMRQEIDLMTWDFPNVLRESAIMIKDVRVANLMIGLHNEVTEVINKVRNNETLPTFFHIPNLWHVRGHLTKGDAREMWNAVGAALCIARHLYTDEDPFFKNAQGYPTNRFCNPKPCP